MAKTQIKSTDVGDGSIRAVDINLSDAPTINSCSGSLYLAVMDAADNDLTKIMTVDAMKAYLPYLPLEGGTLTGALTAPLIDISITTSTTGIIKQGDRYLLHTYGTDNVFLGTAGNLTNIGNKNQGIGFEALKNLTTGYRNSALGYQAMFNNSTGYDNVAIGYQSMYNNLGGDSNVALGYQAMYNNITGKYNFALGNYSLTAHQSGQNNVAIGNAAMRFLATGDNNTGAGGYALYYLTDGIYNVGIGSNAGIRTNAAYNLTSANRSVFIGGSTTSLNQGDDNQIVIGYAAAGAGSNSVVIGSDSITKTLLKGNVGIGTTAPSRKLDINGALRIRTLTEQTSYANVLVADANGNVDYVAKSSLVGSYISNQYTAAQTGNFWISGLGKLNQLVANQIYSVGSAGLTIGGDSDTFTGIYLLSDVRKVIIQPNGEESYFGVYLQNNDFCPVDTDTVYLGTIGNRWKYIYAFNAYANLFAAFSPDTNDGCYIGNAGITGQLHEGGVYGRNGDEMIAVMAFEEIMLQSYHNYYYASGAIHVREYNSTYLFSYLNGTGTRAVTVDANGVLGTTALGIVGYPASGIAVSTGTAWGTSIVNNSANWNTAYGWGNHASAGYAAGNHTHNYDNYISWSITGGGTGYQVPSARVINFADTATIEVVSSYADDQITLEFNYVGTATTLWTRVTGASPYLVPEIVTDNVMLKTHLYINEPINSTTYSIYSSDGIQINTKDGTGSSSYLWFNRAYLYGTSYGDTLGRVYFTGNYSSSQAHTGLEINVTAKGTWGASTAPTQVDFRSGRDGSASMNRRITFDKDGYVVINEDGVGMNFRIEGYNDSSLFETNGNNNMVGIGCGGSIDTKLHIQTPSNWGNTVLKLEQGDTSKPFIDFVGTSGTGFSNSISSIQGTGIVAGPKRAGGSAGNTGWYFVRMIAINVNGALEWIATYGSETNGA